MNKGKPPGKVRPTRLRVDLVLQGRNPTKGKIRIQKKKVVLSDEYEKNNASLV